MVTNLIFKSTNKKKYFHTWGIMKNIKDFFKEHQFIMGVATSITATFIVAIIPYIFLFISFPSRLSHLENEINKLNENNDTIQKTIEDDIKKVEDSISDLNIKINETNQIYNENIIKIQEKLETLDNNTAKSIEKLDNKVGDLNDKIFSIAIQLSPVNSVTRSINELCESIIDENFLSDSLWESDDVIAINTYTNTEYTASQLVNQKLLFSYLEGNQEILFYGQFNSNNQWDGECIINVYENNILKLITEASYNNGQLLKYKQVFSFVTQNNTKVWSVSNRKNEGDFNSGETWHYYYDRDFVKEFEIDKVSSINIISVDMFKSSLTTHLESYYNGNTSNGYYNDKTGNAFLVIYENDGTVKMLYNGEFVQGELFDETGNAWYVALGYDNINYYYYKGIIHNGRRPDDTNNNLAKVSIEEIEKITDKLQVNSSLKWKAIN